MKLRYLFAGIIISAVLCTAVLAQQPAAVLGLDSLVGQFESEAGKWVKPILVIATTIFWSLAVIEFVFSFGMMAVRGIDLNEFTVELLKRILILSFGWWLLNNTWIFYDIISGFLDSAALAIGENAGYRFDPGKMVTETNVLLQQMWDLIKALGWGNLSEILMIALTALIILWGLSHVGVLMLLVMCEMYIVLVQGFLMLGLFSLEMTREYPMKFFGAIIGIGMKLFSLQLIIGLGFSLIKSWTALGATDVMSYVIMAGAAIGFKEIAVKVPDYIQGLFSGSPGSGISAGGAVAAAGAVAGVAAAVVPGKGVAGGVMSVVEAAKLGKVQGASGAGLVGATLKNLGKAAMGVGNESAAETLGGRMGAFNRAQSMKESADKLGD